MREYSKVWAVALTLAIIMMGFSMLFPLIPEFARISGFTGYHLGMVMGAYPLGQLIASPLWGKHLRRFSFASVITLGVVGYAINSLVFVVTEEWPLITMARFIAGVLTAGLLTGAPGVIVALMPEHSFQARYGIYGASIGAGMTAGPLLTTLLTQISSINTTFLVSAIAPSLIVMPLTWLFRDIKPVEKNPSHSMPPDKIEKATLLLSFFFVYIIVNLQSILIFYMASYMHVSPAFTGLMIFISGVSASLSQGIFPRILKIRAVKIAITGLLFIAAGLLTIPFYRIPEHIFLATVGISIISGPVSPALLSMLTGRQNNTPSRIDYLIGLNNSAMAGARIISPVVNGWLLDRSIYAPFLSSSLVALVIALFIYIRKEWWLEIE